jgi:hypothetical protein
MNPIRAERRPNFIQTFVVALAFLLSAWVLPAQAQVDLTVEASYDIPDATYVGTKIFWRFMMKRADSQAGGAKFPTGSTVLLIDLPDGAVADSVRTGNGGYYSGDISCGQAGSQIRCESVNNFTMVQSASYRQVSVIIALDTPGEFEIPASGGICRVDPDDVVDEGEGDGATPNDCTGDLGPVTVHALPGGLVDNWLAVSGLDNIVRAYDHAAPAVVNAAPVGVPGGSAPHLISEVVEHPHSGDLYVLYHPYQTDQHWLGMLDPGSGITAVGATGNAFHDAAFSPDGNLYAIGMDGLLYGVDTATGAATGLCNPNDPVNTKRTGLAWHPDLGLVQVTSEELVTIETDGLPLGSPTDPCTVGRVPLGPPLYDVHSAVVADGQLYVTASNPYLYVVGTDGAIANLGRMTTVAQGQVPDPGTLPVAQPDCPAPFYTVTSIGYSHYLPSLLFAVDPANGGIAFVQALDFVARTLEWDKDAGLLRSTTRSSGGFERELLSVDPCLGGWSTVPLDGEYDGFDMTVDGQAVLVREGDGLYGLDLDSGVVTPLPGPAPESSALAIRGDQVFIESNSWPDIEALLIGSLADWADDSFTPMPLLYDASVEAGSTRLIYDLEVSPDSGQLYGLVRRDEENPGYLDPTARPNVLATISNGGLVSSLVELPVTTESLTGTFDFLLADGFEADSSVNGCYRLLGESEPYTLWTWGESAVSTSAFSENNDRPVFNFEDKECTIPTGPTSPLAHAGSQEEADILCQTVGYPYGQLFESPVPQPPTGQFYGCND